MKRLLGIILGISLATVGFAQNGQVRSDPNSSRDMNNTMDMNSPLYMNNGTLSNPDVNAQINSNTDNSRESRVMNYNDDSNGTATVSSNAPERSKTRKAVNNAGNTTKRGISNGWNKTKHNKLTKHLFNQPSNS
ncbi:MAG: hypothetical protein ACJ75J_08975 [Cytophagaceae bacterium]